jgi:GNAT superfamily N-acetyltransferase
MPPAAPFTIRPLAVQDRAEWQPLWQGYLTFYKTTLPDTIYDRTFQRLTTGAENMFGLAAFAEGRMLGIVHYLFHPHTWKLEPVCYLQDLFTAPLARGKGVARSLIEAVYAKADVAGAPTVYWTTAEDNYPGRMLYDRVGRRTPFIKYQRPL